MPASTIDVRAHVPLAPLTTLGVGGAARHFVEASSEEEIAEALTWARARGLPAAILGGGSNLLVADRGFDGLVLRPRLRGIEVEERGPSIELTAGAGEPWDAVCAHAVARGWAGVECLSGIPGDVGATPIQNVGAYGQEVAETIVAVRALDRVTGEARTIAVDACGFGYRDSVFKREAKDRYVILSVRFALAVGGAPALRYAELTKQIAALGLAAATLADVRSVVLALRRAKSMVLDPSDENGRSAGSFFMNPTLDPGALAAARARIEEAGVLAPGEAIPSFPASGGRTKLAAGWLIERAGCRRGMREGRVGLSTKHALAVVNLGGATSAEVVAFARGVRDRVRDRFGVTIAPEPVPLGFTAAELDGLWPRPVAETSDPR